MGLVQSAQNSGTGTTLTVTLGSATGGGSPGTYSVNGLIVLIAASGTSTNPTAITVTLGGAADNFTQVSTFGSASDAAIGATWLDLGCATGQTAVGISATGGSGTIAITATVYERDDLAASSAFDQNANSVSAGATTWTSTATGTTAQATETVAGAVFTTASGAGTITGPSSPWTNLTQVSQTQGSFEDRWMSGWQDVSSTGTFTYNGTVSPSSQWIAKVVTFRLGVPPVFAHDTQTLGPAGTDNTTTGSYTTTGAQTALSHAASPFARAAVACITQTGSAADQVSGVTYGGAAMTRLRFDSESTKAGATYIYWLDGITAGTQNVVLTTSGSNIKKMVVSTMTASPGATVAVAGHNTGTSASVSNPSWTITGLTAASKLEAYECIHSGLTTMTTTPAASWTLQESLDEGATGRGFARQEIASSGTTLASGWTAATADDFVGSSAAFIEVPAVAVLPDLAMATRIAP